MRPWTPAALPSSSITKFVTSTGRLIERWPTAASCQRNSFGDGPVGIDIRDRTDGFVSMLAQAAQRGVDVKVLFPQDNHHRFASAASEFSYKELLEAGVKIYERPGMFHTKAISVDGQWASIGSGNLMSMLEQTQKELNLDFQDDSTPAQLNRVLFEPDVKKSVQVTLENMGNHVAPLPARAVSKGLDSLISVTEEAKQKLKNWLF